MISIQSRNHAIDLLKGLAIIAVVLYHLGISEYGYLGVDIFFVISGYLVALGLTKSFSQDRFSFWSYMNKRLSRLWPGLVLISAVSLIIGWLFMMPLHYKLNCESVIGTLTFTNNFVQYITGGDYWTSANEFKPLMHTWYIGILMQFYIIVPIIFIVAKRYTKQWLKAVFYVLTAVSFLSLILYLSPLMSESQDFYMLPTRFFELGAGGLLAVVMLDNENRQKSLKIYFFCILLLLSIVLIFGTTIGGLKLRLIIITALSILMVGCSNYFNFTPRWQKILLPISFLGVASYSLYLSHQVFFAFYRYIVNNIFTPITYLWVLLASLAIGILLYLVFEKPLSLYISKRANNMYSVNGICFVMVIILSVVGFYYYRQDGLVRDVPELDLYLDGNNQTPEEYNLAPQNLNVDFKNNGRKNIFVIGDSFGRDWVNILYEAGIDSAFNISYQMYADKSTKERIAKADYVFVATNRPFFSSYNYEMVYPDLFNRKFYRVGMKSFDNNFIGNTYAKRGSVSYFSAYSTATEYAKNINLFERELFKDNFIDMIEPIIEKDGTIRLFTDKEKLITQDGIHLTKAGAKLYADKLNVWQYFE